ncbi:hypothetical protein MATL_G00145250 [Megalops atlanticus]|uniref:Uncharacterized protein n=1 Tax=Megalops atlanticus TaxID=7932 RepID=A0A9D3T6D3_MEGAT|nr:hypothetical protein MATL_G00145250 [Megalops atlanticus]
MAASGLFRELYCAVCFDLFSDPVSLPCDHTFCRRCIEKCQSTLTPQCPECRAGFAQGEFRTNRALRNMADRLQTELNLCNCPEHQEKMKLFCETDRQLICVVCRDGQTHREHKCKPISEAAAISRAELEKALEFLSKDNAALTHLIAQQSDEIRKTKERSTLLMDQITAQFAELQRFLRERMRVLKEEAAREEERALTPLQGSLAVMTRALTARQQREQMLRSALDISESDRFQQWWINKGSSAVEELKNRNGGARVPRGRAANDMFKSEAKGFRVTPASLHCPSLGPYDSHLQFFVWKEMLQVIKPVPTHVTLEDLNDPLLKVSADSVRHVDLNSRALWRFGDGPEFSMSHTWSRESFRSGQQYWEVAVGEKSHWSLGLDAQLSSSKQAICRLNGRLGKYRVKTQKEIPLDLPVRPKKIGTFLDCERKRIYFYNADNMTLIHSTAYDTDKSLFVYFNPGFYFKGENGDPLTVCCY